MGQDETGRAGEILPKLCKAVIDFTSKTTDEIIRFLLSKKESVCGNVHKEQLVPVPVQRAHYPGRKIFMAALYFVFGSFLFTSCASYKKVATRGALFLIEPKHAVENHNPLLKPNEIKTGSSHP